MEAAGHDNDCGRIVRGADEYGIGFIGAGRVGVTLGAYLSARGHRVAGYVSRTAASAEKAARLTGSVRFADYGELVGKSGVIVVTTPDDSIGEVWERLAKCDVAGRMICHTSGSLSSEVFTGAARRGAYAYSVHPMHAFTRKDGDTAGLEDVFFTVEGDGERLKDVCGLFTRCGNRVLVIGRGDKALYHLGNVAVSNLVLALISLGFDCFEKCGIGRESAVAAAAPLIRSNVDNVLNQGLLQALTGPVERNDEGTVRAHAQVLFGEIRRVYPLLSLRLAGLAQQKHPGRDYEGLKGLLNGLVRDTNEEVDSK